MSVACTLDFCDNYYDVRAGRFISEDPIGFNSGDNNYYRYVGNRPMSYSDPSGKVWNFLVVPVLVGTAQGIGSLIGTRVSGGTWAESVNSFGSGFTTGFLAGAIAQFTLAGSLVNPGIGLIGIDLILTVANAHIDAADLLKFDLSDGLKYFINDVHADDVSPPKHPVPPPYQLPNQRTCQ